MSRLNQYKLGKKTILASLMATLLVPALAQAQQAKATEDEDVEVIQVSFRGSLAAAADIKRQDTKVTDAITTEDIGKFPSENIAEAIQRIPGVQISNVNGRGSTISVRGLGSQYARTTLNGQSMASADFTSGFRFDIIQTELASTIEVIKSPSANMDAGGLSGTINIDTASPLSFPERKVLLSAKGQYSEFSPSEDVTPKANATYIDQFADGTVGVLLNVGYQELDDRVDNFWMDRWFVDSATGDVTPRRPRYRRIDRETDRELFNGTVQWRPNSAFEAKLTAVYAGDDTKQDLNQQVFLFNANQITRLGDAENGLYNQIQINNFTTENNRQLEDKDATSDAYTLEMDYDWEDWTFSSVLHYTSGDATHNEEAAILATVISQATLDISNPSNVLFNIAENLADPALYPAVMPRNEYPNGATRLMESDETAVQFDATRGLDWGWFTRLTTGVKYRKETLSREVFRTDRAAIGDADPADLPSMAETGYLVTDFLDNKMGIQHSWIAPNIQAYRDALEAEGVTVPTLFAAQSSYSMDREIMAAYLMADFETELAGMPLRGNFGGRYEQTDRDVNTYLTGDTHPDNEEIKLAIGELTQSYDYSNFLPSANLVLELNDEMQLRLAAAKVLVRPILTSNTQLAPSETSASNSFGTRTYTVNLGQPELKALTANQLDFGWEWYYSEGDSLTVNLFQKDIKNGTVSELVCPGSYNGTALSTSGSECVDSSGNIYDITAIYNDSSELTVKGYEVGWNQSLSAWLPVPGFGLSSNYTRILVDESEGFTLTNSSEQTWNITAYWENDSFSARVALNHRSPYVQESSDAFFAREGRTVAGRNQVDLLLGWNIDEQWAVNFGALNLNGKDEEAYRDDLTRAWQTTSVIGRSYYLGVNFNL
ncbi:TonB-dependent receptor [Rheinheimera marina]|uniref:TonB-dependent receptor n=1 Tax=Rheinheimera marina TaxID=1774958 RepID=A0ABV9JLL3_9GAMM